MAEKQFIYTRIDVESEVGSSRYRRAIGSDWTRRGACGHYETVKNPVDYRKGAVGAMMDEYERAVGELMAMVASAGEDAYVFIADAETGNEECRSIRTMLSHVVDAGYAYMNDLRPLLSMDIAPYEFSLIEFRDLPREMEKMLAYTIATLDGRWELGYDEIDAIVRVSPSGYRQDLEQLLEHAIVHVLRHRRQTERFLRKFAAGNEN